MSHQENPPTNPLLCDIETGVCDTKNGQEKEAAVTDVATKEKPIRIIYFTDPICSSCWGIEPQLRKLKLEYGVYIDIEYHMGGLLPNWSYNSGGISQPSDVAHHWDEVSGHYDMPIDGDVWLEDPLHSSYPPSIAFKAAQLQDDYKAIAFLRVIREMVFLEKKNITKWEYLAEAARQVGLDEEKLKLDIEGQGKVDFEADLALAKQYRVRGFPTIFILNEAQQQEMIYGTRPYSAYEDAILKLLPTATKEVYDTDWEALFTTHPSLTAKEFSTLADMPRQDVEAFLDKKVQEGKLEKFVTKNGAIWRYSKR